MSTFVGRAFCFSHVSVQRTNIHTEQKHIIRVDFRSTTRTYYFDGFKRCAYEVSRKSNQRLCVGWSSVGDGGKVRVLLGHQTNY